MIRVHASSTIKRPRHTGARYALALCTIVVACHDPYGFGGLRPTFVASPDTVFPGDTVDVVFTLRNTTRYQQRIRSSMGCLFFLETLRGNERVPWAGTNYACAAAVTDFTIAGGDSLHHVLQIVALDARTEGTRSEELVPPGAYRVRTRMNADLPELEALVTVVAPGGDT